MIDLNLDSRLDKSIEGLRYVLNSKFKTGISPGISPFRDLCLFVSQVAKDTRRPKPTFANNSEKNELMLSLVVLKDALEFRKEKYEKKSFFSKMDLCLFVSKGAIFNNFTLSK